MPIKGLLTTAYGKIRLILNYAYGINVGRATKDIDFAVEVADWSAFDRLKAELLSSGEFEPGRSVQRLVYKGRIPVDIVPFGRIAGTTGEIDWPPDQQVKMRVAGFEDAFKNAGLVRLRSDPVLDVLIATPRGLALLKIIAWRDRLLSHERMKDASDLNLLLRTYADAGNQERLFEAEDLDFVSQELDYVRAGARLLGRDIARIASPQTSQILIEILDKRRGSRIDIG